ncbi:hypothetical protein [Deinococcus ficus]|nr:hypothetical protein [Deinococcus ficus]
MKKFLRLAIVSLLVASSTGAFAKPVEVCKPDRECPVVIAW